MSRSRSPDPTDADRAALSCAALRRAAAHLEARSGYDDYTVEVGAEELSNLRCCAEAVRAAVAAAGPPGPDERGDAEAIQARIAVWSMRPAPGSPEGRAWEHGARQGWYWGLRSRTGPTPASRSDPATTSPPSGPLVPSEAGCAYPRCNCAVGYPEGYRPGPAQCPRGLSPAPAPVDPVLPPGLAARLDADLVAVAARLGTTRAGVVAAVVRALRDAVEQGAAEPDRGAPSGSAAPVPGAALLGVPSQERLAAALYGRRRVSPTPGAAPLSWDELVALDYPPYPAIVADLRDEAARVVTELGASPGVV